MFHYTKFIHKIGDTCIKITKLAKDFPDLCVSTSLLKESESVKLAINYLRYTTFQKSCWTVAHRTPWRSRKKRSIWPPDLKMAWWQGVENSLSFLITPFLLGYLTGVSDHHLLPWFAIVSPSTPFNGVHGIHSLDHPAEDNMLPIQPIKLPFQELQVLS